VLCWYAKYTLILITTSIVNNESFDFVNKITSQVRKVVIEWVLTHHS